MKGAMAVDKTGSPIEATIAEAADLYRQRWNREPAEVRIHTSNPRNLLVDVPVVWTDSVPPGHAWAVGGEE